MTHVLPEITKQLLLKQCREIGLSAGDIVMIHASMRAVGEIVGGPDVLISALQEAVGSQGTLMAYVGCQLPFDDVGRGVFTQEEESTILEHCPAFEFDKARASRDFGAFAEFFRTTRGAICSQHVSCRMAAMGSKADWLLSPHPMDYGFGKGTPLERLCEAGGKVLLIGSDLDSVTLLHYAEGIAPISNKRIVNIKVPLSHNGQRQWLDVEEFNSSTGICEWRDNYFAEIVSAFIEKSGVAAGTIGRAKSYALDAQGLVNFALPYMVETARKLDNNGSN